VNSCLVFFGIVHVCDIILSLSFQFSFRNPDRKTARQSFGPLFSKSKSCLWLWQLCLSIGKNSPPSFLCLSIKTAYGKIKARGGTHLTAIRLWLRGLFSSFPVVGPGMKFSFGKAKYSVLNWRQRFGNPLLRNSV